MINNYFYKNYKTSLNQLLEDIVTSMQDTFNERTFLYFAEYVLESDLDTYIIYSVPDLLKIYLDYLDRYYLSAKTDFLEINTTYQYIFAVLFAKNETQSFYTSSLINLENYFLQEKESLLEDAHQLILEKANSLNFDLEIN